MAQTRRVIITGATGNLGRKASEALSADVIDLVQFTHRASDAPGFVRADLTTYNEQWARTFDGANAVVHLAADPRPITTWESAQQLNIDLSLNVFRAAENGGVGRMVFASSNWVLGGYRFSDTPLTPQTPPRPVNPYGASKLFIERAGFDLAARTGMTFLALRIGYCQPGENRPGPHMAYGRWGQELWLSNDDWAQAVVKSCTAPCSGAWALNIFSGNHGMRWDLQAAKRVIGYEPVSRSRPVLTAGIRARDFVARLRDTLTEPGRPAPPFRPRW